MSQIWPGNPPLSYKHPTTISKSFSVHVNIIIIDPQPKIDKDEVVSRVREIFAKFGCPDFPITTKHVQDALEQPSANIEIVPDAGIFLTYYPIDTEIYLGRFRELPGPRDTVDDLFTIYLYKPYNKLNNNYMGLRLAVVYLNINVQHIQDAAKLVCSLRKVESRKRLLDI